MTHITHLMTIIYARLLGLYPPGFRAEFGDEMRAVFASALADAAASGLWATLWFSLREMAALPRSIVRAARREARHSTHAYRVYRTRWIARYNAIWFGGLILLLALQRLLRSGEVDALRAMQMLMAVSLVLAWRWERLGGLIAALGGVLLCGLGLLGAYWSGQGESLLAQGLVMLVGALWGLPYLIFGGLFLYVGMQTEA
ncbi:MAG: hypothetical protein AB1435_09180 [Chloroflexota bacterium]|jgi:hypothetical protein